jgi:3-aminobutyryl-CoA ammonia-lyase
MQRTSVQVVSIPLSEASSEVVVHRRYVAHAAAHYGGGLVDGAYALALFGDVATELCVRGDGDEGLFAGYREIRFLEPIIAGDFVEVRGEVTRVGSRSREINFTISVTCRATPERSPSAAQVLTPPLLVVTATGTVVVPVARGNR